MCGHSHHSNRLLCFILLSAASLLAASSAFAAQPNWGQQIDGLTTATSLDRAGMQPWHMRLTFQLFDLKGNPQESGTVEEWWASAVRARVVITSPSFNETLPGASPTKGREAYLVHLLLKEVAHPMPKLKDLDNFDVTTVSKTFGQKSLSCINVEYKNNGGPSNELCTDPETTELRILTFVGIRSHAMNELDTFANTQIAKTHTIAYLGHPAIQGHIESIEPFDLSHSNLVLGPVAPSENGLTSPKLLTRIQPIYPRQARDSRQGGFTVLRFDILPNGRISPIDIIASSGSSFTDASTDAARRWEFIPMKRNGSPAESESTITIIFVPRGEDSEGLHLLLHEETSPE